MHPKTVSAIFDIGKTNKKLFLFDDQYRIVWEKSAILPETKDEDGDACEDLELLNRWVTDILEEAGEEDDFKIGAINFSAYGASFVHLDRHGKPATPLYNYLKPYPEKLQEQFYVRYDKELPVSLVTASPVLGSLNSGMQLYRLKYEKPKIFSHIRHSLHLPQYLSWLFTGRHRADITSIGCHTQMWNFLHNTYHDWVHCEGLMWKIPSIASAETVFETGLLSECVTGIGLHDSSAALIPYLEQFPEPFVLISTGTWCISMNPFNHAPLTSDELRNDCLFYMTHRGRPVKSSRLFAGREHETGVESLAQYFQKSGICYQTVLFDPELISKLKMNEVLFQKSELAGFDSYEEAYHALMMHIIEQQVLSTRHIIQDSVKTIFVDGGFSRNEIYMQLLADAFPDRQVFAASVPQASAIGAAVAIHPHWNSFSVPDDLVKMCRYN